MPSDWNHVARELVVADVRTIYGGVAAFWTEEGATLPPGFTYTPIVRREPDRVERFTDAVRVRLNSGIIQELPGIPADFTPSEKRRVIEWMAARGTPGFGPLTFVPAGGPLARREAWSAAMTPEAYAALKWDGRKWIARQWGIVGADGVCG